MIDRWQKPASEPIVLHLWNDQYIKLMDRRGQERDIVFLGLNITTTVE